MNLSKLKEQYKDTIVELSPAVSLWTGNVNLIKDLLSYKYTYWLNGRFSKERHEAIKVLVSREGVFLTGFIDRITAFMEEKKIPVNKVTLFKKRTLDTIPPTLPGITFRSDQNEALKSLLGNKRGICIAPTGSGKTVLIAGVISAFPKARCLVIVHTKDLMTQTFEEMKRFFGDGNIGFYGAGKKDVKQITVASIQTLRTNPVYDWDVTFVDECHHVSKLSGTYAKFFNNCAAEYRYGMTATPPTDDEAKLSLEGVIGPMRTKTTYNVLMDNEVLAKPKVVLKLAPAKGKYVTLRGSYKAIYEKAIVQNRERNDLIMKTAKEYIDKGLTVLILVEIVEHGKILKKFADLLMPKAFQFVRGETKLKDRDVEKQLFEKKKRKGVIATRVWGEGINIRSIGVVINAVGGESEKAAIQRFGRGLRKVEGKDSVVLVDFIDADNHRYFQRHSMKRITYYSEIGWI